jgi:DNA-binding NarL/FixJ family response regulator
MSTLSVAVYADDAITESGLTAYVRQHPRFTFVAAEKADIAVVSVALVDASTAELLQKLSLPAQSKVVLVAPGDWNQVPNTAVMCRVRAMIPRDGVNADVLARTILTVAAGKALLPALVQGRMMDQAEHLAERVLAPLGLTASGLTGRELEVLRMFSAGQDLNTIAEELSYSERTIKKILSAILSRFELKNRTHAVAWAIRLGYI